MRKEPIRHHYIPQFILRNFACDNDKKIVCYYDNESGSVSERKTCEIFMERNLYRDEINCANVPVQIEHDLAKYEAAVAKIIKERFLESRKIELTVEEDKLLKLFFAIMSFRAILAKEQFTTKISPKSKDYYKHFQANEDFEDFWKRNLGHLVQCRSIDDVMRHPKIDLPIKDFMVRDTIGFWGKYFVVVEAKEGENFILGDCYPVIIFGDHKDIVMYDIFPISPKRTIILASVGVDLTPRTVLSLRPGILDRPQTNENGNIVVIRKRLLAEEVHFINREIKKNVHKGYVFVGINSPEVTHGK